MRRALVLAVVLLAACSSGTKKVTPPPPTTTSTAPTTTTTVAASTSTTAATTTTTTPPRVTTTTRANTTFARIVRFNGPSKVLCNAPTSIELKWVTQNATKVALTIDGQPYASFTKPTFDGMQYFACDGKPHTYTITATGTGPPAHASLTVTS
jgi:hypothetical protein